MKGVNKFIGLGIVGQDPETKTTQSGSTITNISIAISESWKDKQTGEKQERTEWVRIVFFNRLAEIAAQYLNKGSKVYVEGQLRTRKWQDNNGQDRYTTEIVANEMQILDSRGGNAGAAPMQQGNRPQSAAPMASQAPQVQQSSGFDNSFDDDLPF